jgi:hypothetical protein
METNDRCATHSRGRAALMKRNAAAVALILLTVTFATSCDDDPEGSGSRCTAHGCYHYPAPSGPNVRPWDEPLSLLVGDSGR